MKAVVMSDSHKNFNSIIRIMDRESDVTHLIHAGDVQQDVDDMESVWSTIPVACVLGNNDYFAPGVPFDRIFTLGNVKIFLTHGHQYCVKQTLSLLRKKAKELNVDICIFGHTHTPYLEQHDNIWFLNPGSTSRSYATITLEKDDFHILLKEN